MMTNRKKLIVGDLIRVPFKKSAHTYARILVEGSCAFYDCPSTEDRNDYENIIAKDILFVTHVFISTINEGNWTIIANIPLDSKLATFYPKYFNPAPQNKEMLTFIKFTKMK